MAGLLHFLASPYGAILVGSLTILAFALCALAIAIDLDEAVRLNLHREGCHMATVKIGATAQYQLAPVNALDQPAPVFAVSWSVSGEAYVIESVGEDNGYTVAIKAVAPGPGTLNVTATSLAGVVLSDFAQLDDVEAPVDEEAVKLGLHRVA